MWSSLRTQRYRRLSETTSRDIGSAGSAPDSREQTTEIAEDFVLLPSLTPVRRANLVSASQFHLPSFICKIRESRECLCCSISERATFRVLHTEAIIEPQKYI